MSGAHRAPKDGRKDRPVPDAPRDETPPPARPDGEFAQPAEQEHIDWAEGLAALPWSGPAAEPPAGPAAAAPGSDGAEGEDLPPSPEWLESIALGRRIPALLVLAGKALSASAADRERREREDAERRGLEALVDWAADASELTRPYAMTAVLPVPQQGERQ